MYFNFYLLQQLDNSILWARSCAQPLLSNEVISKKHLNRIAEVHRLPKYALLLPIHFTQVNKLP